MRMIKFLWVPLLGLIFACTPDQDAPRYIHISEQILETTPEQGAAVSDFKDAWIFVDGTNIGHYELPRTIPVIYNSSSAVISIQAGVRENGILSTPSAYPFTNNFEIVMNSAELAVDTLTPNYNFHSGTKVVLFEGFEANHLFTFDADNTDTTNLVVTSTTASTGSNSGMLQVGEEASMEVASSTNYSELPLNNTPIYVEFDYKSDIEMAVGLLGYNNGQPLEAYFALANPSEDWQRLYVDISPLVLEGQLDSYRLLFQINTKGLAATSGTAYIDNIKWLHIN